MEYKLGGSYMHKINVGPKYIESCVARALLTTNNFRDGHREVNY